MVQTHNDFQNESRKDLDVAVRNRGDSTAFTVILVAIAALGVLVSVAIANLVLTGNAHADTPQGDIADTCRAFQTDFDANAAAFNDPATPASTRSLLQSRMSEVSDFWEFECADDFGDIAVGASAAPPTVTTTFEALDFSPGGVDGGNLASTSSPAIKTN